MRERFMAAAQAAARLFFICSAIQSSTSDSIHPTDLAPLPRRIGAGNVPAFMRSYMEDLGSPVFAFTLGYRMMVGAHFVGSVMFFPLSEKAGENRND
jgi:hypothetical protein